MEQMLEPFIELQSLSLERQCQIVVACSVPALIVAAMLREFVVDRHIQICARLFGAGAVFALVCFANYATSEALKAQQFVKKAKNVSENAAPAFVVANQVNSPRGITFEWTSDGGSSGPVRVGAGCFRRGGDKSGGGDFLNAGTGNGPHAMSDAADAASDRIANAGRRF